MTSLQKFLTSDIEGFCRYCKFEMYGLSEYYDPADC